MYNLGIVVSKFALLNTNSVDSSSLHNHLSMVWALVLPTFTLVDLKRQTFTNRPNHSRTVKKMLKSSFTIVCRKATNVTENAKSVLYIGTMLSTTKKWNLFAMYGRYRYLTYIEFVRTSYFFLLIFPLACWSHVVSPHTILMVTELCKVKCFRKKRNSLWIYWLVLVFALVSH